MLQHLLLKAIITIWLSHVDLDFHLHRNFFIQKGPTGGTILPSFIFMKQNEGQLAFSYSYINPKAFSYSYIPLLSNGSALLSHVLIS